MPESTPPASSAASSAPPSGTSTDPTPDPMPDPMPDPTTGARSRAGTPDGARGDDREARTYFDGFEDAMEALPVPLENRPRMRQVAAGLPCVRVWIPRSHSYIAVADAAPSPAAAYFDRGLISVRRAGGGYDREELTTFRGGSGGARATAGAEPVACPSCFMQLPATGVCDTCG